MAFSLRKVFTVSSVISPSSHARSPVRIRRICNSMKNAKIPVRICCVLNTFFFSGAVLPAITVTATAFLCLIRLNRIAAITIITISASIRSVTVKKDHPNRQPAKWATSVSPMMIRLPPIKISDVRKVILSPNAR